MCGFLGWFRVKSKSATWERSDIQLQDRALGQIIHRGPDDASELSGERWWMGFRRLSIQDLSGAGRQPMTFRNGRFTLTFNGEIYNSGSLRGLCTGHRFKSSGDTETLGALLNSRPVPEALSLLRGMFAFAWWDQVEEELVVARDHFGIKPLYYHVSPEGELRIGSEVRALKTLVSHSGAVSITALHQFLHWGSVKAPETIFKEIRALPPGHFLSWKAGKIKISRWFEPVWPQRKGWIQDPSEQKLSVLNGVLESVETHLLADVPVGIFLSAGLDSSVIAASLRHLGHSDVQAFSIGYRSQSGVPDESVVAARTANFYGCRFTREIYDAERLEGELGAYFKSMDQPTGDALNTYLVSQIAAQKVKVALSGLGADEWFAGYNHHRLALLAAQSPLSKSRLGTYTGTGLNLLDRVLPAAARAHRFWKAVLYAGGAIGCKPEQWQEKGRTILSASRVKHLVSCDNSDGIFGIIKEEGWGEAFAANAPDSWLHQLLLMETDTYLANTLLRDNDVASMAHSLELRVPFVDRDMFALAGRIPPSSKLNSHSGKQIIRKAFADMLPPWINLSHAKQTFTLPLMKWMKHRKWRDRITDILHSERCRSRGWLNPEAVDTVLRQYFNSRTGSKLAWHLSQPVWLLFVLESWAMEQIDGP